MNRPLVKCEPRTEIAYGAALTVPVEVLAADDYAVAEAHLVATVTTGAGEAVKFRELTLNFDSSVPRPAAHGLLLRRTLDLRSFGLAPGDELYFHVVARDTRQCDQAITGTLKGPWLGGELEFAACMIARNYQTFVQVLDAPLEVRRTSVRGGVSAARILNDLVACERFASELAWAYWQSPDNSMKPSSSADEAGAVPVAQFRAVLTQLIGAPIVAQTANSTKAFAPETKKPAGKPKLKRG